MVFFHVVIILACPEECGNEIGNYFIAIGLVTDRNPSLTQH